MCSLLTVVSTEQVFLSFKKTGFFSSFGKSTFSLVVQVLAGIAQAHLVSIPRLFTPLTILKKPYSPQCDPQLFLPIQ